ncbi:Protein dopey-1, partial [Homalodisca vitripennis]
DGIFSDYPYCSVFNAQKETAERLLFDCPAIVVKESSSSEPSLRSNSTSTPSAPRRHLQYRASLTSGNVDHLHSHLLLYCGVYDSQRALYALQTVRNMLATNARAFLCSSSTTGLVS